MLYSGAAVGVSHLVSSTTAGARYGYTLIIGIIIIHIIKYPCFYLAHYYTNTTGKNILYGYKKVGQWSIILVTIITYFSMFIIQMAVSYVTGILIQEAFPIFSAKVWSVIILIIAYLILLLGKYEFLDKFVKYIVILLSILTIISVIISLFTPIKETIISKASFSFLNKNDLIFLVFFLGWMPAPMDISIWNSIWTENSLKIHKQENKSFKINQFNFNLGFLLTCILGILFLILGAKVLYHTNIELSKGGEFAKQFVNLYTVTLGKYSYPIILFLAFLTMFSTTITCLDSSPRVLSFSLKFLKIKKSYSFLYKFNLFISLLITSIMILFFLSTMKKTIVFATGVAFITAPIIAILNHLVIFNKNSNFEINNNHKMKLYSFIAIILLSLFSLIYILI